MAPCHMGPPLDSPVLQVALLQGRLLPALPLKLQVQTLSPALTCLYLFRATYTNASGVNHHVIFA